MAVETSADSVLIFVLSLLVGTIAILTAARLIVDADAGWGNAALTALVGALIWAASSMVVGWVPILGVLLMLVVWVGIINWRYPGGWGSAVAMGFVAWVVAIAVVYAFSVAGIVAPEALGIPGA